MRAKIVVLLAAAALAVGGVKAPEAESHKAGWCGHTVTYWSYWSYGSYIQMREKFLYDFNTGGRHFHQVETQKAVTVGGAVVGWTEVHEHTRDCGSTPA